MRTTTKLLLMVGSALGAIVPMAAHAAPPEATIKDFAFSPETITIPLGSTLRWTNTDGVSHTVTADDGSFSSPTLGKQATFSHAFDRPGPVAYHCAIHTSMHGTVQVDGATTTTAAAATATTTEASTTTTIATAPVVTTAPAPATTAANPALSSTTRGPAAPTTTRAPASTTTAPTTTTTAPPASAPADAPPSTTLPAQVALDSPSGRSGRGGAGPEELAAGIATIVVLLGGAGWVLRRRFSAG